jgi:5'-nucleotidase
MIIPNTITGPLIFDPIIDVFANPEAENKPQTRSKEEQEHGWILTYSGRKFYPLSPHIDSIVIQDIAHALSNICRFTGHCFEAYSVAQHCVLVSYLCDIKDNFYGLLHDASEAYLTDISAPVKHLPEFKFYRDAETKLQTMIYKRFGLEPMEPSSVKIADKLLLATEARDLMPVMHSDWKMPVEPLPFKIEPLSSHDAEKLFLKRFKELFPQHKDK